MPASYFLGTRLLGTTNDAQWWSDTELDGFNLVMFCPKCGDSWGRLMAKPNADWHAVTRPCTKHPYHPGDDSAGSFIAPWKSTLAGLPREVLLYELSLRLERIPDAQPVPV